MSKAPTPFSPLPEQIQIQAPEGWPSGLAQAFESPDAPGLLICRFTNEPKVWRVTHRPSLLLIAKCKSKPDAEAVAFKLCALGDWDRPEETLSRKLLLDALQVIGTDR